LDVSRVVVAIVFGTIVGLGAMADPSRASLYSPEDPTMAVTVGADGKAQAVDFSEFERRLAKLNNALDDRMIAGKANKDREQFLERIANAEKNKNLTADETAALAGDLLRVGQLDRAINLLIPRTRDRRPSYFVFVALGHIYATRGDWMEAIRYHQEGLLDTDMPLMVKGLTPPQRDWWKKLDAQYLPHFYKLRQHEAEIRKGLPQTALDKLNESEDVLPLFPLPDSNLPRNPVRFVNDAGIYQPSRLAAVEQAKLPTDAIAVVQQLLLWFPGDTRLYWLLAELYAASNNLKDAATLFEKSSWSRQYGNRKVMMDHRAAVRSAVPKDAPAEDAPLTLTATDPPPPPPAQPLDQAPITMRTIWYYFGAIGLIALFAFIRALSRRSKGSCGPGGCR
jgi:hypothetical protein